MLPPEGLQTPVFSIGQPIRWMESSCSGIWAAEGDTAAQSEGMAEAASLPRLREILI